MKVLHTSDWHLGRALYGKKRYREFSSFLDWLIQTIQREQIDILLIAGDVFDTTTPTHQAQALYYQFLCQVAASCCRHVVVIAGNHDSPSFLNAPKPLLLALNVHVIGAISERLEDEVITLYNDDEPEAIVCAVPYLREKDLRTASPGESIDSKNTKIIEGLKAHYNNVCAIAEKKRNKLKEDGHKNIPIIAMGHLFTTGGKTMTDDGVRELYVGSLAHVSAEVFPASIDYLALGHLHVAQRVGQQDHMRYCGAPIAMGFDEAKQTKKVILVTFDQQIPKVELLAVPCFQLLIRMVGSLDEILAKLNELRQEKSTAWLEIEYTGNPIHHLRDSIHQIIDGSGMEVCRIKSQSIMNQAMHKISKTETLNDLDAMDVFTRCLNAFEVPDEDREALISLYHEVIKSLDEDDIHAI